MNLEPRHTGDETVNEIRQEFEAWATSRNFKLERFPVRPDWYRQLSTQDNWNAWRAAYEAGEIAMKEKAAKTVEHFADELTPEEWPKHGLCPTAGRFDGGWSEKVTPVLAKWVRALPLSGAEESKK